MLSHKGTIEINTDRLLLRKFKLQDADDMFNNWGNDKEVTKFLSWKPHKTIEVTREFIDTCINEYKKINTYHWAIELKEIGQVFGSIGLVELDNENYSCEIGYCISRKYWSKGMMTESLHAVIDYLFSEIGLNRIVAKHDTNNIASGKVMIKSGMKCEGTLREVKVRNDKEFYNLAVYSILKSEWLIEREVLR
ncbi:GNAT family N-acetyltransferase [Clostridium cibarium]|uniref:GNAT family N-acetyltransferase n=1 Tax=Clostridium cibarium TaxID=2762247 RepID=A0ABR8PW79_9CLOT|nr:GNAT family N-acetyltransferase [Clostridium cibarium]MBD7912440.1 GNAT family N-acetyltransferase [Clostridium cibarium]